MADIIEHNAEHMLSIDPYDPIDGIELVEHWEGGRRFVAAIVSVRLHDGAAYKVRASGPEVVGTLGTIAGPNRGYISMEWHSLSDAPEPIRDLVAASGVLHSAVSS